MKVELESLSTVKKKLAISVPETDVKAEFDEAYEKLAKKAQIPGFRKGKAPRSLLEQRFSADVASDVYESLVRRTIVQAMKDHKLDAVAMPEITDPKHDQGEGFSYVAAVEVKPEFEPKDYKGLTLKKAATEPTNDQIDEVLKRIQDGHSILKDREGAKKPVKGDFVSITIQGIDAEGNLTTPGQEPKEQSYEIGGEILHADVEKAVLTLAIGEVAPVTVSGKVGKEGKPDETEEKTFHVRVTLKGIKEKVMPAMDDAFAKSVGPFETLSALRSRVVEDLKKELEETGRAQMIEQILKDLVKANPVDLPPSLVETEVHQLIHGFWSQLERSGFKEIPEEYSEEKLHEKFHPDAERRVHEQLLIEAIAEMEKLSVSEEELSKRIAEMAKASKIPVAEFRAYYEKSGRLSGVRFTILAQKTLDFLLGAANIK